MDRHEAAGHFPAVSVVVCTHSAARTPLVLECVASVAASDLKPHEIMVVVDSNRPLYDRLGGLLPPDVILLASRGEGVSEARNTAIAAATGEVVAFIDDDAVAEPTWLTELSRPFADAGTADAGTADAGTADAGTADAGTADAGTAHVGIVGVGGRVVPRWARPNRHLPDELLWVVGCTYAGHPVTPQPITRPIGCNMAFRRTALDEVGGFPKEFGPSGPAAKSHSNEENALALKLRRRYGPACVWYTPDAVVRHFVPAARGTWGYLWHRCVAEGVSKADVRLLHGGHAMDFDRGYARRTLLPAIWRYAVRGVADRDRAAAARAAAGAGGLAVTAAAYAGRLVSRGLVARRARPGRP